MKSYDKVYFDYQPIDGIKANHQYHTQSLDGVQDEYRIQEDGSITVTSIKGIQRTCGPEMNMRVRIYDYAGDKSVGHDLIVGLGRLCEIVVMRFVKGFEVALLDKRGRLTGYPIETITMR